jgi:hypothetical protein
MCRTSSYFFFKFKKKSGKELIMAEGIEGTTINPPNPPTEVSKLPAWATGMAVGELMAEQFIETNDAWAEFVGGDEEMAEGVAAVFQHLMSNVMQSIQDSTDYLEEMDDEENPAANLLPK